MLLFAEPGPARAAYEDAVSRTGAACAVVGSLREMREKLRGAAYCGLLIDVPTLIKSAGAEKRLAHSILEHYPVLRLRFDPASGVIHGLFYGQSEPKGDVVGDFVALATSTFSPRAMRGEEREDIVLNVLVHRDPSCQSANAERAVTVNASLGGCFIYTCADYAVGEEVGLEIMEVSDRTPIRCRLRWRVEWGKSMSLPGIGVAFEAISPEQSQELAALLGLSCGRPHPSNGCGQ